VIDRAAGFFVENNENYNVTWEEANELISLGPNQVKIEESMKICK
jgi:hypothetical protein